MIPDFGKLQEAMADIRESWLAPLDEIGSTSFRFDAYPERLRRLDENFQLFDLREW
ncbi:MAG: hypothetical protein Ct9H90mP5_03910 [Acidimicrobiaceae bacterium]|nr:MAG: hypothetical protein Ct9H90mP5_03910 [Acidimicrobiaceae bacterium]